MANPASGCRVERLGSGGRVGPGVEMGRDGDRRAAGPKVRRLCPRPVAHTSALAPLLSFQAERLTMWKRGGPGSRVMGGGARGG